MSNPNAATTARYVVHTAVITNGIHGRSITRELCTGKRGATERAQGLRQEDKLWAARPHTMRYKYPAPEAGIAIPGWYVEYSEL